MNETNNQLNLEAVAEKQKAAEIKKKTSDWEKRKKTLSIVAILVGIKEVVDIIINLIAILPGGIIITFIYNITVGSVVTILIGFTFFGKGFKMKQKIIRKIIMLVTTFFAEMIASFLPTQTVAVLWVWHDEKKDFKKDIAGVKKKDKKQLVFSKKFKSLSDKTDSLSLKYKKFGKIAHLFDEYF